MLRRAVHAALDDGYQPTLALAVDRWFVSAPAELTRTAGRVSEAASDGAVREPNAMVPALPTHGGTASVHPAARWMALARLG